jgi:hypothetical protein
MVWAKGITCGMNVRCTLFLQQCKLANGSLTADTQVDVVQQTADARRKEPLSIRNLANVIDW